MLNGFRRADCYLLVLLVSLLNCGLVDAVMGVLLEQHVAR